MTRSKRGFTLVELVVVIAVLAVLAAIAIPVAVNTINNATLNTALTNKRTISNCIATAQADIAVENKTTYGEDAVKGTITVGQVIKVNSISEACESQLYYSREIVPVWNSDIGEVVIVYTDDYRDVESGVSVTSYISISDTEDTLIKNLPMS